MATMVIVICTKARDEPRSRRNEKGALGGQLGATHCLHVVRRLRHGKGCAGLCPSSGGATALPRLEGQVARLLDRRRRPGRVLLDQCRHRLVEGGFGRCTAQTRRVAACRRERELHDNGVRVLLAGHDGATLGESPVVFFDLAPQSHCQSDAAHVDNGDGQRKEGDERELDNARSAGSPSAWRSAEKGRRKYQTHVFCASLAAPKASAVARSGRKSSKVGDLPSSDCSRLTRTVRSST